MGRRLGRRWLVVVGVVVAGMLVGLGSLMFRPSEEPAETIPEGLGATIATVSVMPLTSNTVTTVGPTANRLPQQGQTSTTTRGDDVSNAVEGEAETPNDPDGSEMLPSAALSRFLRLPPPVEIPLDWDGDPVEFRVLAMNPLDRGYAVVDLADRVMRLYPLEHHYMSLDSVKVVAFTPRGDVLVSRSGKGDVYVIPDADFSATPAVISPSNRALRDDADRSYDFPYIQALADRLGEKVWLLQWPRSDMTLVDLVTIEDNTAESTVELDGIYWISGLLDDSLYVVGDDHWGARAISPNGIVREVSSCEDYSTDYGELQTLAVFRDRLSCITLDGRHVILYDETTGQVNAFTAIEPHKWSGVVLPNIPAVNTTGIHSDQMLLQLRGPNVNDPPYYVTESIHMVDLTEQTVRLVYDNEQTRFMMPLGIVDGLLITSKGFEGRSSITLIDIETGEGHKVVNLPKGYFVYDAK